MAIAPNPRDDQGRFTDDAALDHMRERFSSDAYQTERRNAPPIKTFRAPTVADLAARAEQMDRLRFVLILIAGFAIGFAAAYWG